jgi:hypothetical protein
VTQASCTAQPARAQPACPRTLQTTESITRIAAALPILYPSSAFLKQSGRISPPSGVIEISATSGPHTELPFV